MAKQVNPNGKKSRCNRNRRNDLFAGKPIVADDDKSRFRLKKKVNKKNDIPTIIKAVAKKPAVKSAKK